MLEIYVLPPLTNRDIDQFTAWVVALNIPYVIYTPPTKPAKQLSAHVQASHLQAGIWHLPIKNGHLRILLAGENGCGLQSGQTLKQRAFAGNPDKKLLNLIAMHELGHMLKACAGREVVLKLKPNPEFELGISPNTKELVNSIQKTHSDNVVDLNGLHCLHYDCIMQVSSLDRFLEVTQVQGLFCLECMKKVNENKEKLLDAATKAQDKTCIACKWLTNCMRIHGDVWEESPLCNDFETV